MVELPTRALSLIQPSAYVAGALHGDAWLESPGSYQLDPIASARRAQLKGVAAKRAKRLAMEQANG